MNAAFSMVVTPAGRSSEVIAVSLNAQSPIVFNVLGKVKDVMFVHSRKAPDPIVSSLLPRSIVVSDVQLPKA